MVEFRSQEKAPRVERLIGFEKDLRLFIKQLDLLEQQTKMPTAYGDISA